MFLNHGFGEFCQERFLIKAVGLYHIVNCAKMRQTTTYAVRALADEEANS
jgi:hypothetical protein